MKRFVEAVKNMFRIQDLRNRVLFTLALMAVYRIGAYIPIPGINSAVFGSVVQPGGGLGAGHLQSLQRRQLPPHDDFCARHHAVHHVLDHLATDDGGCSVPGALAKKKASSGAARSRSTSRYLTIVFERHSILHDCNRVGNRRASVRSRWSIAGDTRLS